MVDALVLTAMTVFPVRTAEETVEVGRATTVGKFPGRVTTVRVPELLPDPLLLLSPLGPAPSALGFLTTVVPLGKTRLKLAGFVLSDGGKLGGLLLTGIAIAVRLLMADIAFSGDMILFNTVF